MTFNGSNNNIKERELIDFLSGNGRRYIAVIYAYLDESGTHKGSKILCVAGYAGNQSEWELFEKEWRLRLVDFGISCFHAKDPNCDPLRPYLAQAIEDRELMGVVCSVNPDVFDLNADNQFKSTLGNAYAACALMCGVEIGKWAQGNKLGSVSFVLEAGQPNTDFVSRVFNSMIEDPTFGVAAVAVARKSEFVPLQTADFLSHVYSVSDHYWLKFLMRSDRVLRADMTLQQIDKTSKEIKALFSRQRNLRRRERKEPRL